MMKQLFLSVMALLASVATYAQVSIIPQPRTVVVDSRNTSLVVAHLEGIVVPTDVSLVRNAQFLSEYTGLPVNNKLGKKSVAIRLSTDSSVADAEGYRITIAPNGISLVGGTPAGVFYGIQVLRQMLFAGTSQLTCGTVASSPRYAYRGMHLDVCRHFFDKTTVKRYLDMMALHGMNTLHWHLSDDQGWRIEIKKWPRLTQVGAWRDRTVIGRNMGLYDHTRYGGFFTQDDIREIVRYAEERFITIVPEIDMPGHMVAALTAYPELGCTGGPYEVWPDWGVSDDILCAGNPRVYEFLEDVISEVIDLFPSKIVHLGGDEAPKVRWKECPKCQQKLRDEHLDAADSQQPAEERLQGFMVRYMEQFLAKHGRQLMGWDEIIDCDITPTSLIMNWRDWKGSVDPVTKGFDVVRTPNSTLYFDHYPTPQTDWSNTLLFGGYAPLKKVYDYDPAPATLTEEERAHVMGVQANMWTEYVAYPELIEYLVLPRMAALSEVQWGGETQKEYAAFLKRLQCLLNIYEAQGWKWCKKIEE